MSGLFQSRKEGARDEFKEMRRVLRRLKLADGRVRTGVGAGVLLANADFLRRYAGIESFRTTPPEEQKRFCAELSDMEMGLRSHELGMALGVGLYRIWLTDLLAGRRQEAELLGEELTELSRRIS